MKEDNKTESVLFRVTKNERAMIEKCAQKAAMTTSEYVRATLLMAMVLEGETEALKIVAKSLGAAGIATVKKKLRFVEAEATFAEASGVSLAAAKRAIPDELVRAVAAVGTQDEVRRRLAELAEIGVTDIFFNIARSPGGIGALGDVLASIGPAPSDRET